MLDQQGIPVSSEEGDVTTLIKTSLAFGPSPVRALREVGIIATEKEAPLPQGYIDLIVYSADKRGMVALKDSPKQLKPPDDNLIAWKTTATSIKTPDSFSSKGCTRQCIVELLSLSEVLKSINRNIEFVVLLKASRDCFQPFVYFIGSDALITTQEIPFYNISSQQRESAHPIAFFFYYLLLNEHLNTALLPTMEGIIECGWSRAFSKSKFQYFPGLVPQRRPKKAKKHESPNQTRSTMSENMVFSSWKV